MAEKTDPAGVTADE
ncbi:hypothetical protein WL669_16035 [Escherichia ruysiae]|nr:MULTISPECIES: hypothetical protein [Escherichia]